MRNTHGAGDVSLVIMVSSSLGLGLRLGFREPQSPQVKGYWAFKYYAQVSMRLQQEWSLDTFLIVHLWCYVPQPPDAIQIGLGFREQ